MFVIFVALTILIIIIIVISVVIIIVFIIVVVVFIIIAVFAYCSVLLQLMIFMVGGRVGFFGGNVRRIMEDLQELK